METKMLKIGDLVRPNLSSQDKERASWKPQGEMRIKLIRHGKHSGYTIISAVDERGYKYTGVEGCFERVEETKNDQ